MTSWNIIYIFKVGSIPCSNHSSVLWCIPAKGMCVSSLGWEFWGTISSLVLNTKELWCYLGGNQSWWTLGKENNVFSEGQQDLCYHGRTDWKICKCWVSSVEFLHHKRATNAFLGISSSLMGEAQSCPALAAPSTGSVWGPWSSSERKPWEHYKNHPWEQELLWSWLGGIIHVLDSEVYNPIQCNWACSSYPLPNL